MPSIVLDLFSEYNGALMADGIPPDHLPEARRECVLVQMVYLLSR